MRLLFILLTLSVTCLPAESNAGTEALAKACGAGDLKMAENLLSSGVNPDMPDMYGHTALYYAASFGETKAVELLLAYHADPNAKNGHPGADAKRGKERDTAPGTPLQCAAEFGNLRMSEMLISAGAQINAKTSEGRTALHFAVAAGRLDSMRFLIDKGAEINARDVDGISPLDDAVWNGDLNAVAILLAHGARLNEPEPQTGATPINEAAYRGRTRLVQYLLQFNPDLGVPDNRGDNPLENAIRKGKEDSALLLIEAAAKQQQPSQFLGKTMDTAIKKEESSVVEALLRHRVPANGILPSGATPLNAAAFAGSIKTVGILLQNGADPNLAGQNGTSPLEDASLKGFDAIAGLLLDHGARINQVNSDSGTTALYAAASFGKGEVVRLLLRRGANPNLCGKNRKSPYQAALENGYQDVAGQIQAHGGKSCEQ